MKFGGNNGNVFQELQFIHGPTAYQNMDIVKRIRNTLKKFISSNGCYHKVIVRIVNDAIQFHEKWRCATVGPGYSSYRSKCVVHSVLIIGAHFCQRYNILEVPQLIRDILKTSYACEGGFDRFLCFLDPLIFPFEVDPILYPTSAMGGANSTKHLEVLEYFLSASQGIRETVDFSEFDVEREGAPFSVHSEEVGMVEVPVTMCRGSTPLLLACHSICSSAVLLLLRYGANPLRPGQVQYIVGMQFQLPIYVIVTKLNASVFWSTHNQHLDPTVREQFMARQKVNDRELKQCIRYFCRVLPRLPVQISNHVITDASIRDSSRFQLNPRYADLIPDERRGTAAELTHLCRCVIRDHLKSSGHLPSGINQLPLPSLIKEYLDLQHD